MKKLTDCLEGLVALMGLTIMGIGILVAISIGFHLLAKLVLGIITKLGI